jgi:hypothetical protein
MPSETPEQKEARDKKAAEFNKRGDKFIAFMAATAIFYVLYEMQNLAIVPQTQPPRTPDQQVQYLQQQNFGAGGVPQQQQFYYPPQQQQAMMYYPQQQVPQQQQQFGYYGYPPTPQQQFYTSSHQQQANNNKQFYANPNTQLQQHLLRDESVAAPTSQTAMSNFQQPGTADQQRQHFASGFMQEAKNVYPSSFNPVPPKQA